MILTSIDVLFYFMFIFWLLCSKKLKKKKTVFKVYLGFILPANSGTIFKRWHTKTHGAFSILIIALFARLIVRDGDQFVICDALYPAESTLRKKKKGGGGNHFLFWGNFKPMLIVADVCFNSPLRCFPFVQGSTWKFKAPPSPQ